MNRHCSTLKFVLIISILLCGGSAYSNDNKIKVVMLNPAEKNNSFWGMTTDFLLAAAADLNIEVEVLYSNRNHVLVIEQAEEVLSRAKKPDYLLTGNEKGTAGRIIKLAEQSKVKVFLFNNGFIAPEDLAKYGKPRLYYSYWIGQLIPDNYSAGYLIAKHLIDDALSKGLKSQGGKIKMVALAGTFYTHASMERVRGLKDAVAEYPDSVELLQVVPGDWTEKTAELKSRLMFSRYNNIAVLWGVNDATVLGAMKSARQAGKTPGKDILLGGCNWFYPAITKVKDGTISTTVGGHFMDGAWSLVMLYDYHHGIDFQGEREISAMSSIDASNVDKFIRAFGAKEWDKVDFTKFSKVHNPSLDRYDFSFERVLEQFP